MKIAVITIAHNTPLLAVDRCLRSVRAQTIPCEHWMVGAESAHPGEFPATRFLKLPVPMANPGALRSLGAIYAIDAGADAITFLDAEHWYAPDHLERMQRAALETRSAVITSGRAIANAEGVVLETCREVDGENLVAPSCLFLTRPAFGLIAYWFLLPAANQNDKEVWKAIKASNLRRFHQGQPTVFAEPPAFTQSLTPRISLCVIARNEAKNLAMCLPSFRPFVHEIVVVDNASEDDTCAVARRFGARVVAHPAADNLSECRNRALETATGDWILSIDADEYLSASEAEKLALLRTRLERNTVYWFVQRSLMSAVEGTCFEISQPRLFPKLPGVHWTYRMHEQIMPSLTRLGCRSLHTDICIEHFGYRDRQQRQTKFARNARLIAMDLRDRPHDPHLLHHLGAAQMELGELAEAEHHLTECISHSPEDHPYLPKTFVLLSRCFQMREDWSRAVDMCARGRRRFPNDPDLMFEEGYLHLVRKRWTEAVASFEQLLRTPITWSPVGSDPSIRSTRGRFYLALAWEGAGEATLAEELLRQLVEDQGQFVAAWVHLGEMLLHRQRFQDLVALKLQAREHDAPPSTCLALEGMEHRALGQLPLAAKSLEAAVNAAGPDCVGLASIWCDFLLRHRLPLGSARSFLADAVTQVPNQPVYRHLLRKFDAAVTTHQDAQYSSAIPFESTRTNLLLSLCMIVRNEEETLGRCLTSVRDLVDEIIVVDTGSHNRTLEIATSFGATVHSISWPDSFSAARNESVRHARGKWILYLDADEYFDEINQRRFAALRCQLTPHTAYLMRQMSHSSSNSDSRWATDHARLFPNLPGLAWRYRVHEQILPFLISQGCTIQKTDIELRHSGFADPGTRRRKLERNRQLLVKDLEDFPSDGFVHFNLATCHIDLEEREAAVACLRNAVDLSSPDASFVPQVMTLLAQNLRLLGEVEAACRVCTQGLSRFPHNIFLLFEQGLLFLRERLADRAEDCFRLITQSHTGQLALGIDPAVVVSKAHHELAVLCRDQSRYGEAVEHERQALALRPDFLLGWTLLAELLTARGDLAELERLVHTLDTERSLARPVLKAHLDWAKARPEDAIASLHDAAERHPAVTYYRLLLCQMVLRLGSPKFRDVARRHLDVILASQPSHAQARSMLDKLLPR